MNDTIFSIIQSSIDLKTSILSDPVLLQDIADISQKCIAAFRQNNKILWCGNGGSAADAQHLAAELSGRFYFNRPPLNSEALHVNDSYLTAVANDFSFEAVFARKLEGIGQPGDILIALSTSGNSPNILRAVEQANKMDIFTIGLTGLDGGQLKNECDILIKIPSQDTPRIQECHMLIGHIICEIIESTLFEK